MRSIMLISMVVMQFTILPFFTMLASAHGEKHMVIQSGMSVVYKTTDEAPDWLKRHLNVNG